jgi:zinc finger SWIM domain-containing protein 3
LSEYSLEENSWILNLYSVGKVGCCYRDSFTADMTTTQKSEGMNNVFKKQFRRKLSLSELLVESEKVSASLQENESYEDFKSR